MYRILLYKRPGVYLFQGVAYRAFIWDGRLFEHGRLLFLESIWTSVLGHELSVEPENDNEHDRYAVSVKKNGVIDRHVPRSDSRIRLSEAWRVSLLGVYSVPGVYLFMLRYWPGAYLGRGIIWAGVTGARVPPG